MKTVQGLEQTPTHHYITYSRGRVHLVDEYLGKPICRTLPMGLRPVDNEPTCKKCLSAFRKHKAFGELQKPVALPKGFHVWDYPSGFYVHLDEPTRLALQSELAYRGEHGGKFSHNLRRSSHRAGKRTNQPGAIRIRNALALAKHLGVHPSRMESEVSVVFQGTRVNGLTGPFPIQPNEDWAWLTGLWFGCGRYNVRDRLCPPSKGHPGSYHSSERTVAFHVEEPVKDELIRIGQRIGCLPVVSTYMEHENKHFTRVNVFFPGVVYFILRKWGLPPFVKTRDHHGYMGGGRRITSREIHLGIPDFVKATPRLSHAFVEGYLNSSKFQAWHKIDPSPRMKTGYKRPSPTGGVYHKRGCFLTFTGSTEEKVLDFLGFMGTVLQKGGVGANPYRMQRVGRNVAYKLQINNDDRLLRCFRIFKENAQALIRQ